MKESLSFGGGTYRTREIILVTVAVVAVALCILFLGLYATKPSSSDNASKQSKTSAQHAMTPKPNPICETPSCLETTAYVWSLVNTSANPCEDFYSYACGYWPSQNPLQPNEYTNSVIRKIRKDNELRIRRLLESPKLRAVPWGSERKVKDLYRSCLNEYGRMKSGGNPFIEKVLKVVGGWYVVGNFNADRWDLLTNIEKVHVDFGTNVLFTIRVATDWTFPSRRIISLSSVQTGMYRWYYTATYSYANKTRTAYMDYMRTVAGLLVRDADVSMTDTDKTNRINVFVDDVMNMESILANISSTSRYDVQSHEREKKVRINNLTALTDTTFNWVSFFSYMFDKPRVSEWTFIAIPEKDYIRKMSQAINNLGPNKNRILNNYFTWTMLRKYVPHMSAEYIHAARAYRKARFGYTEFSSTWEECFDYAASTMKDAMSHLYIKDHFADENKDKVTEIAQSVRQALVDSLTGNSFMDAETRAYARTKVQSIVDKIGYPQYILDNDSVDRIYQSLEIHDNDYFQNVLNMNKFARVDMNKQLQGSRADPDQWGYHSAIDAWHAYIHYLNQVVIPAGLLQHPIYDYKLPHYLNFGSVGTLFAESYIRAIDRIGSLFDKDGDRVSSERNPFTYNGWWSDTTLSKYTDIRSCLMNYTVNKTESTTTGGANPVRVSSYMTINMAENLAEEVWMVKIAMKAYQAWVAKNGAELMPPSIGLTNQQMYFVAYAQTQCYVNSPVQDSYHDLYGFFRKSFTTNMALSQVKEFSDVFKCPDTAMLNPSNRCPLN